MKNIGGTLDYRLLADLHRPSEQTAIAEEVRRLSRSGLKPRDIAQALHVACPAVEQILRDQAAT